METGAIIAISAGGSAIVTALLGGLGKRWWSSKKDDAETMKALMESEKLSQEAKVFIEKAVEERDRNINLKIKGFQQELLNAAELNYEIKKKLLDIQGQNDELLASIKSNNKILEEARGELAAEQKVRAECVKRLDELERQMNTKKDK